MKTNLLKLPLLIVLITFISCQKEPDASFKVSKTDVVTGEEITFTNTTLDGDSFEWNFGDGETSNLESPTHSYENAGSYTVEMTAYSKNGNKSDKATASINVSKANEISFDGNKYALTKGYLDQWDEPELDFALYLVDDGITVTKDDIFGQGNMIYLELWSSSSTSLQPGTYTFSDTKYPQTFSFGAFLINYDVSNDVGVQYIATGGTVTVSQEGSDYEIDAALTLATGKTVNAHYKGQIIYYDQTYKKSKKKTFIK